MTNMQALNWQHSLVCNMWLGSSSAYVIRKVGHSRKCSWVIWVIIEVENNNFCSGHLGSGVLFPFYSINPTDSEFLKFEGTVPAPSVYPQIVSKTSLRWVYLWRDDFLVSYSYLYPVFSCFCVLNMHLFRCLKEG